MRSSSQVSWGYSDAGATKMCTSTAVWEATIRSLKDKSEVGGNCTTCTYIHTVTQAGKDEVS